MFSKVNDRFARLLHTVRVQPVKRCLIIINDRYASKRVCACGKFISIHRSNDREIHGNRWSKTDRQSLRTHKERERNKSFFNSDYTPAKYKDNYKEECKGLTRNGKSMIAYLYTGMRRWGTSLNGHRHLNGWMGSIADQLDVVGGEIVDLGDGSFEAKSGERTRPTLQLKHIRHFNYRHCYI